MTETQPTPSEVTHLLRAWRRGDRAAFDRLMPLIYADLRRRANRYIASENSSQSWQATDLVHESFLRLLGADVSWQDRTHFLALASRTMRRLLVDRARAKSRKKRTKPESGVDRSQLASADPAEILDLNQALRELESIDPRKGQILELCLFGDLSVREIAEAMTLSRSMVHRDLQFAKAWLHRRLSQ